MTAVRIGGEINYPDREGKSYNEAIFDPVLKSEHIREIENDFTTENAKQNAEPSKPILC